jgi:hypothetical protein
MPSNIPAKVQVFPNFWDMFGITVHIHSLSIRKFLTDVVESKGLKRFVTS